MKTLSELKTDDLYMNFFQVPIYDTKICFLRYQNDSGYDQALDFCKKLEMDVSDYQDDGYKFAYGFTFKAKVKAGHVIFLFINACEEYKEDYTNTLSHEAYHALQQIMRHHELQTYKDSANEHIAYLVGSLNSFLLQL